jgi:hypothetical protein
VAAAEDDPVIAASTGKSRWRRGSTTSSSSGDKDNRAFAKNKITEAAQEPNACKSQIQEFQKSQPKRLFGSTDEEKIDAELGNLKVVQERRER